MYPFCYTVHNCNDLNYESAHIISFAKPTFVIYCIAGNFSGQNFTFLWLQFTAELYTLIENSSNIAGIVDWMLSEWMLSEFVIIILICFGLHTLTISHTQISIANILIYSIIQIINIECYSVSKNFGHYYHDEYTQKINWWL